MGEDAISQRLKLLGIILSDRGVSLVLKRNGIPPAKERSSKNVWSKFLQDHWPHLYAIDFATFEIPGDKRTYRCHALYAMKLSTREVKLLGVCSQANGRWTAQLARNECDEDGFFAGAKMIIMDRDPMFRGKFRTVLESSGIAVKLLPPKSPNLNAYMERFIGTVRREVCRNYIPLGEDRLRIRLEQHVEYYNRERTHQGLNGKIPDESLNFETAGNEGVIKRKSRLGNLLNYYYRDVA